MGKSKLIFLVGLLNVAFQNCAPHAFSQDKDDERSTPPMEIQTEIQPPISEPSGTLTPTPFVATSSCEEQSVTTKCPSNASCTCNDVLPAGTYRATQLVWGKFKRMGTTTGTSCFHNVDASIHSGTVVGGGYGICLNYCTVQAKCVDGQWTGFQTVW